MSIFISNRVQLADSEVQWSAIRAQGAGGQHVNHVNTAVHLRFDILASSLPDSYKQQLIACKDTRMTGQAVIVIKSQQFRSQHLNKQEALKRLQQLIQQVMQPKKARKATQLKPSVKRRRREQKSKHSQLKQMRRSPMT